MINERIAIIAANNICYSPYINYYKNILDKLGLEYELIYPNRSGFHENWAGIQHVFKWNNKIPSLINYYLFSRMFHRILKEREISKAIILTTQNAVFSAFWLNIHYFKKCVIDVRDYTYENHLLYYLLEKIAFHSSNIKIISSEKFKLFLPKSKYYVCHNISSDYNTDNLNIENILHSPIRIGYIGSLAYFPVVKEILNLVKQDERFSFYLYGSGPSSEEYKKYVDFLDCPRIKYQGHYNPEDKSKLIEQVDILFNCYGNSTPLVMYALSNKLYDSLYYHKPLLNSCDTYMHEMGGMTSYGFDLNNEHSLDGLYNWVQELDYDSMISYQNELLKNIIIENESSKRVIESFLKNQ